ERPGRGPGRTRTAPPVPVGPFSSARYAEQMLHGRGPSAEGGVQGDPGLARPHPGSRGDCPGAAPYREQVGGPSGPGLGLMGGWAVRRRDVSHSSTDFSSLLALITMPGLLMQMNALSSTTFLDFRPD